MALTRKMRREKMVAKAEKAMEGSGIYIYQNILNSELMLPKPTTAGRTKVGPREKFVGDSYYKKLKEVMCIQTIQEDTPVPEQKLITEVPPTVTTHGTVEYVQSSPELKPLNEETEEEEKKEILLVESPVGSVQVEGVRIMR